MYRSAGKEKESRCLVFTFFTKREIRPFHLLVVNWRQRNVHKSVMHLQSCCLVNLNLLLFCPSRWRRRRRCSLFTCLSSLQLLKKTKSLYFQKKCVLHAISVQIWIRNCVHWRHKIAKESSCNLLLIDSHWFLWKSKCHDWCQCWK